MLIRLGGQLANLTIFYVSFSLRARFVALVLHISVLFGAFSLRHSCVAQTMFGRIIITVGEHC
jgi:hypothetical protein